MQCSIARLESALAGKLPADEETALHQHLDLCDECSTALEGLAGGPAWCRETAALLGHDEFDDAVPPREEWSEIDFTVEHLEPADEPGVLGRLGGYDVLEIIGHGGMGVVLKAFDRELKRTVAIKVLAPHLARNSLARKRFAREAQAAAAVVHPHVLAIHQVQASGRLPFLVMPLVAGESLAERLAAQGTLELKEILRIGMQAAAGLAAAHEQGLVHRDVKPANILLERGVERAVLTDFGLARAADDVTLTRWGVVAGTPQYMSPEQARGEPLDGRSDLFSLGCVLYEMATGVSPFRTESPLATMRRLVDDSPQPMDAINAELPPWFGAIVHRLLEKDPARRFQSAAEVSELLEECLAHVQRPAAVPLPDGLPSDHQPDRASGRFWKKPWASGRRGDRLIPRGPRKLLVGAALALPLIVAGVVIVLETNKGTLTIESVADDVAVRITEGDDIVEKLTVTRGKNDVRIAAGQYRVEIDGKADRIAVEHGKVTIERGGTEIVKIVQRDAADGGHTTSPEDSPARTRETEQATAVDVDWVAREVATRIEQLKSKYPQLEEFSVAEHLKSNASGATKLSRPPRNPPLYVINYKKGIVSRREALEDDPNKYVFGPDDWAFDKASSIDLAIYFFERSPGEEFVGVLYDFGDFCARVRLRAYPTTDPLQRDIHEILKALGAQIEQRRPNERQAGNDDTFEAFLEEVEARHGKEFSAAERASWWEHWLPRLLKELRETRDPDWSRSIASSAIGISNALEDFENSEWLLRRLVQLSRDDKEAARWRAELDGVHDRLRQEMTDRVLEWIGLHLRPISKGGFREKNVFAPYQGGLDVTFVRSQGPAEKAGIHEVDIVVGLQGRETPTREAFDLAMDEEAVEQLLKGDADALQFDVLRNGETVRVNVPFPIRELRLRDNAARIAKQVAARIVELKDKYPHFEKFSAAEHLRKNTDRDGTVPPPGTVGNPELYSISYHNGVIGRKPSPSAGPRRAAEFDYDPETGIHLNVHFFQGDSRGNDLSAPYRIGDLNIHVHVRGPAADPIRREIVGRLEELGAVLGSPLGALAPPQPAGPPGTVDPGRPNFQDAMSPAPPSDSPSPKQPPVGASADNAIHGPTAPTTPDSSPRNSNQPAQASGFSETKELVLSMNSNKFMLDLDTGDTMDPPATIRPEQAKMDLSTTQVQPYHYPTGLVGHSLQGIEVKSSDWNASVAEVRRALAGDTHLLKSMDVGPEENPTYFFKTRDGAVGILQLVDVTDEPKGIRLRYKTVQADTRSRELGPQETPPVAPTSKTQGAPRNASAIELRLAYGESRPGLVEMNIAGGDEKVYVAADTIATDADIASAEVANDAAGQPVIQFTFKDEAGKRLRAATEQHRDKPLAILVNGNVLAAPIVRDAIGGKAMISGKFSREEAQRIVTLINSLPKEARRFQTRDGVHRIAASADGKLIAVANGNPTFILMSDGTSRVKDNWMPTVEILDANTGTKVTGLNFHLPVPHPALDADERANRYEVTAIAFSPVEEIVAVGTSIGQVFLCNARNGMLMQMLDDEKPRLANKETPESWKPLKRAIGRVESLAFSPDGSLLAVCGPSFTDFSNVFDRIERGGLGRHVTAPGRLKVFDVKTGALKHDLAGHSHAFDVAFSSDGSLLASAGRWEGGNDHGNGVLVWNPQTGEKLRTILIEANGGTHFVDFSPTKKQIVTGSIHFDKENDTSSTSIAVINPLSGVTEWRQTVPGWAKPAFMPDQKFLAVLCGGQSIQTLDAESGLQRFEVKITHVVPGGGKWNDFTIAHKAGMLAISGSDTERRGFVTVQDLGGTSPGAQ